MNGLANRLRVPRSRHGVPPELDLMPDSGTTTPWPERPVYPCRAIAIRQTAPRELLTPAATAAGQAAARSIGAMRLTTQPGRPGCQHMK